MRGPSRLPPVEPSGHITRILILGGVLCLIPFLPRIYSRRFELAARLKVKPGWVYEKIRPRAEQPMPFIQMGRYIRFHWPAVSAWLANQQCNVPKNRKAHAA